MVKVAYPGVPGSGESLALTYGTSANSYSGFDRFGRVVNQKWYLQSAGTVRDQFAYAYDYTSNRISRDVMPDADPALTGQDDYYQYDGLDRLMKRNRGSLDVNGAITDASATFNQAWAEDDSGWKTRLDPLGNWTKYLWDSDGGGNGWTTQTRTHDTANKVTSISGTNANWVDPAYDLAGNMTAGPQPRYETVDANTQLYVYDAWNRLTKVYQDDNEDDEIDDPDELVVTYSYDGLNRRIRKVLGDPEDPDATYDYYYNESWQVLEVRKDEDPDPLEQYVWGAQYIDAPVVRFYDGDLDGLDPEDEDDSTLYYTYDGNFNVTAVIKPDGTVAERYAYDPYGQVTFKAADWSDAASQVKSAYDNEILYCGYRFDPESGNYIARRRYLTPPLGRWTTREPLIGNTAGSGYHDGMNLYEYSTGSPTNRSDHSGLWVWSWGGTEPDMCDSGDKIVKLIRLDDFDNCKAPTPLKYTFSKGETITTEISSTVNGQTVKQSISTTTTTQIEQVVPPCAWIALYARVEFRCEHEDIIAIPPHFPWRWNWYAYFQGYSARDVPCDRILSDPIITIYDNTEIPGCLPSH